MRADSLVTTESDFFQTLIEHQEAFIRDLNTLYGQLCHSRSTQGSPARGISIVCTPAAHILRQAFSIPRCMQCSARQSAATMDYWYPDQHAQPAGPSCEERALAWTLDHRKRQIPFARGLALATTIKSDLCDGDTSWLHNVWPCSRRTRAETPLQARSCNIRSTHRSFAPATPSTPSGDQ